MNATVAALIRPIAEPDLPAFRDHFERHRAESGRQGDLPFMPFEANDESGPKGLDPAALKLRLTEIGWQRWWIVIADEGRVVGHVNLKGDGLRTGLHRCELGVGLEKSHRAHGLGRQLMTTAIDFARAAPSLEWIDLRVFAHNTAGRRLYQSLGFTEVGIIADRFRIDGASIDDVIMVLPVA